MTLNALYVMLFIISMLVCLFCGWVSGTQGADTKEWRKGYNVGYRDGYKKGVKEGKEKVLKRIGR